MPENLIRSTIGQETIEKILAAHPRRPLLPPLDSEPWRKVTRHPLLQPVLGEIRARAASEADEALPPLSEELFLIYHRTGSRWEFETVYFERRRRLARATVRLLASDPNDQARPALTRSVLAKLTEIFEEVAWSFPAHLQDSSRPDPFTIDLFCAETANLLAEMLDLFGAIIPEEFRQRILARLRTQIWENYLARAEKGDAWWIKGGNNWNAVCHQGVLGSALSALDDNALLARMLCTAREGLPVFLANFGADGGSSEGPGYWDYGFGWFALLNEQLERRTEGELSLFEGDPHVLEIARFGPRSSLSGGHLIGFSDSPSVGLLRASHLIYLGERLHEPLFRDQAVANYAQLFKKTFDLDFQRADLLYFVRFLLRFPDELPDRPTGTANREVYLKDLGVMITSATDEQGHLWELAAKAGHNAEHHNHNDCGSFTLNIDATRFFTEIGQPLYTRDFFGPQRYENLAARSLSHSLPLINGCEQAAGRQHAAKVLEYANSLRHVRFVMDLAACYPNAAACRRLIRVVELDKAAGSLTVRDEFELADWRSAETAAVTIHPVTLEKNEAVISAGALRLQVRPDPGTTLFGVREHTYRHHDPTITVPAVIQRIVFQPVALSSSFTLGFVAQLI